jgi:hypothetical protein
VRLKRLILGDERRVRTSGDLDDVDVVRAELLEIDREISTASTAATEHHVATQALKRQFEERLAARKQRRRRRS